MLLSKKIRSAFTALLMCSGILAGCGTIARGSTPDVAFQDVSLSLETVNPEEQLHHFDYDHAQPLDVEIIRTWRSYNVTVSELTYQSPRGERVPTLLFEPDGEGPFAGLVLMHGAPGTKENFTELGVHYARYGYVAIAIDAPQFRSDHNIGHVSMALIWPRFEELDVEEQSQLIVDLQRAVDLLLSLDTVDPERLTYIGGSYGGAMGGLFAGVEHRLDNYVLKVGDGGIIEHLSEPDERGYPNTLKRWVDLLWPIEPLHFVGRAAPAELLFQNGITDEYVPVSDVLRYQQAASEPKTIMWYNAGHFLPKRHYYDHLLWQHERIGVQTLLLKPFFGASGYLWDTLLTVWFALTALTMVFFLWARELRARDDWRRTGFWIIVSLFLGPISLLFYRSIKADKGAPASPGLGSAVRRSLGLLILCMTGFALLQQISFLSYAEWKQDLLPYYILPLVVGIVAWINRRVASKQPNISGWGWITLLLTYISTATFTIAGAYFLVEHLSMLIMHFHFPIYHPVKWFMIMMSSITLAIVMVPLVWLQLKVKLLPGKAQEAVGEMPAKVDLSTPLYPLALSLVAFAVLFVVHVFHLASTTPIYISFSDIARAFLGIS